MGLYHGKFFNHIASIRSERGLRCGAVYHPWLYCVIATLTESQHQLYEVPPKNVTGVVQVKTCWPLAPAIILILFVLLFLLILLLIE